MSPLRRGISPERAGSILLLLLLLGLFVGCGGESIDDVSREVAPPPSVRVAEEGAVERVRLDAAQAEELAIRTVTLARARPAYMLALPGTVYPAPENLALVSAPISGRVTQIYAHEGEAVRKGQVLLELESLEYAGLVADFLQAQAEENYQTKQVDRLQLLVDRKISPPSTLEKAQADLLRARAAVQASHARLHALGVTNEQLEGFLDRAVERPVLPIYSPIHGTINEHEVDLGQSVTAYQQMMSLVNLDQVLIRGYVSPEDASLVRPGDSVVVGLKNMPGRSLQARIKTINPALDEASKSVTVNIIVDTEDSWPLPGENVRLQIQVRSPQPVLTVPLSAVEYEGEQATVFVRTDSLTFEKRPIGINRLTEDQVIVASGLEEGDEIAVSQIFSLKALGRFEQYAEE